MRKTFYNLLIFALLSVFFTNSSVSQSVPAVGDILITEFMANPSSVSDTNGEWIEIYNLSSKRLLLNNLILSDLGSNEHQITSENPIIMEPEEYFVLARNANQSLNGGISVDYEYSNFTLGNTEDEIILMINADSILDMLAYTPEWPHFAGTSLELDPAISDIDMNDQYERWHPAVDSYGNGDLGTPGKTNSISTYIFDSEEINYFEAFPNPCPGELWIRFTLDSREPININLINLLGHTIPLLEMMPQQIFNFSMDLNAYPSGIYWLEISSGDIQKKSKIILL